MPGQLTETEINIRKQTLESDLENVKESIAKLDAEKVNLVAQHHAICGAIQQCDLFIEQLSGGNDKNVTSSIPSEPNKKTGSNDVAAAVMS